jgi:regulator of RNase E activity RraA
MQLISLKDMTEKEKIQLLRELGYGSDGKFVLNSKGDKVKDKYVNVDITLSNMLILPGSAVIIDNNPLSIASYIEEYKNEL